MRAGAGVCEMGEEKEAEIVLETRHSGRHQQIYFSLEIDPYTSNAHFLNQLGELVIAIVIFVKR